MAPGKTQLAFEFIGHCFIGLVPMWGWLRERSSLPPENDRYPVMMIDEGRDSGNYFKAVPSSTQKGFSQGREYWAKARVMDMVQDNLGYEIGSSVRTAVLVGLLIWRW